MMFENQRLLEQVQSVKGFASMTIKELRTIV